MLNAMLILSIILTYFISLLTLFFCYKIYKKSNAKKSVPFPKIQELLDEGYMGGSYTVDMPNEKKVEIIWKLEKPHYERTNPNRSNRGNIPIADN